MTNQLRVPTAVAGIDPATACAEIDLAAFRANVATLQEHAGVPAMVVVKADGYGHGIFAVRSGGKGCRGQMAWRGHAY